MKPILFSTPMVQAIIDGHKTMTRRVMKPQPWCESPKDCGCTNWNYGKVDGGCLEYCITTPTLPYESGDILWVRETWQKLYDWLPNGGMSEEGKYFYYADGEPDYHMTDDDGFSLERFLWRPSIHMPREAARIFLRVTDVRAERLQDIGLGACFAEGCPEEHEKLPKEWFHHLWDSLNAKRGYSWEFNPWVWVISFERIPREQI